MIVISILILVGIAFSGLGIWIPALVSLSRAPTPRGRCLFFLYTGFSLQVASEVALVTAYQLVDVQALLAARRDIAVLVLGGLSALGFLARCANLYFAARAAEALLGAGKGPRPLALCLFWAGAYIGSRVAGEALWTEAVLALLGAAYSAALAAEALRFLLASRRASRDWRLEHILAAAAGFAYLPAKAGLAAADGFSGYRISPLAYAWTDIAFFLALNIALSLRAAASGSRTTDSPGEEAAEGPPFEDRCAAFGLSRRETEVAGLLLSSDSYKDIARALCISLDTVKSHAKSLYRKTKAGNRLGLGLVLGPSPRNHPAASENHPQAR